MASINKKIVDEIKGAPTEEKAIQPSKKYVEALRKLFSSVTIDRATENITKLRIQPQSPLPTTGTTTGGDWVTFQTTCPDGEFINLKDSYITLDMKFYLTEASAEIKMTDIINTCSHFAAFDQALMRINDFQTPLVEHIALINYIETALFYPKDALRSPEMIYRSWNDPFPCHAEGPQNQASYEGFAANTSASASVLNYLTSSATATFSVNADSTVTSTVAHTVTPTPIVVDRSTPWNGSGRTQIMRRRLVLDNFKVTGDTGAHYTYRIPLDYFFPLLKGAVTRFLFLPGMKRFEISLRRAPDYHHLQSDTEYKSTTYRTISHQQQRMELTSYRFKPEAIAGIFGSDEIISIPFYQYKVTEDIDAYVDSLTRQSQEIGANAVFHLFKKKYVAAAGGNHDLLNFRKPSTTNFLKRVTYGSKNYPYDNSQIVAADYCDFSNNKSGYAYYEFEEMARNINPQSSRVMDVENWLASPIFATKLSHKVDNAFQLDPESKTLIVELTFGAKITDNVMTQVIQKESLFNYNTRTGVATVPFNENAR